ncbi:MAG: pyruvate, water dikinase regulatory protein [Chloroflexota bacterium]|nr:pyruvate, water dikinase regulatory protein [Chloroflexota bacterium]
MPARNELPIYVVSGGTGTSATAVLDRALSQFPSAKTDVHLVTEVRDVARLEEVVLSAALDGGTIVHTLVEADLREAMVSLARNHNVVAIDLIGRLLQRLSLELDQAPLEEPGLYRQLHDEYFRRVEAIEFSVSHDDGQRARDLENADIVLTGVSRVSKTPLSVYLSTQGWKVANVPIVVNQEPPQELFEVDRNKVVALTVEPAQLQEFRLRRGRQQGLPVSGRYGDIHHITEELEWANLLYRRGHFAVVDVTGRSIEETAQVVVDLIRRRMNEDK